MQPSSSGPVWPHPHMLCTRFCDHFSKGVILLFFTLIFHLTFPIGKSMASCFFFHSAHSYISSTDKANSFFLSTTVVFIEKNIYSYNYYSFCPGPHTVYSQESSQGDFVWKKNGNKMSHHFTSTETAIVKKSDNNKCWRSHGKMRPLVHWVWGYKIIWLHWKKFGCSSES